MRVMDQKITCQSLDRLFIEWMELQEDISGLSFNLRDSKIGDFGCGRGFITWCLRLLFPNSECIGVDKFDPRDPPDWRLFGEYGSFSLDNVRNLAGVLAGCLPEGVIEPDDHGLMLRLRRHFLLTQVPPVFRKADLITGEGFLPELEAYFDFIFCKRVCSFIYSKDPWSDEGIDQVLQNITRALKPGGKFCLVEIKYIALDSFLKRAGFEFSQPRFVFRPYSAQDADYDSYPYMIYHCHKK